MGYNMVYDMGYNVESTIYDMGINNIMYMYIY